MKAILIKKRLTLCIHLFGTLSFHWVLICMVSVSNQQDYYLVNLYVISLFSPAAFKIFLFIISFSQVNHGVPCVIFLTYSLLGVY